MFHISYRDEAQQKRQMMERMTRDEILVKMGELEAQKRVLLALQAQEPSPQLISEFAALESSLSTSNSELNKFANETERLRQKCLISRIRAKASGTTPQSTPDCDKYAEYSGKALDTVSGNTELYACVQDIGFQVDGYEKTREALNETVKEINDHLNELSRRLATTDVKFSHLAREAQHAADTQDQLDSKWLTFYFDSEKAKVEQKSSYQRKTSSIAASGGASGGFWSVKASFSHSRSKTESSFERSMNSAKYSISGELLRVTVQRPWFRPSLFKSKQFQIRVSSYNMTHYTITCIYIFLCFSLIQQLVFLLVH